MDKLWARRPLDPVMEMHVPRLYGSTPTLFGAPLAEDATRSGDADVAFIGIPWRAPTPNSGRQRGSELREHAAHTRVLPDEFHALRRLPP